MTGIFSGAGRNNFENRDGYGISFNAHTSEGEETAIVVENNYYILLGDHRGAYKDKKLNECLNYFMKNADKKSSWSNDLEGIA